MTNPWKRKEVIGDCVLYEGDCLEIMPTLDPVDAVVTDPPYGIEYSPAGGGGRIVDKNGKRYEKRFTGSNIVIGDDRPFDPTPFLRCAPILVFWGANNYADKLPASTCWLIWDKRRGTTRNDFADCEMAWTNKKSPARILPHLWTGMLRDSERGVARVHPTQKAIAVMEWCLKETTERGYLIFDPFMGSGTTGVACAKLGRKFIGIELEPKYFDIACERIEKAYRQPDLFVPAPKKMRQEDFDL